MLRQKHRGLRTEMNKKKYLIVTIDTEVDRSFNWRTSNPVTFYGVEHAVQNVLGPLFKDFGVRPTYLLSGEVINSSECVKVFKKQNSCELGVHLHGDFVGPVVKNKKFPGALCDDMQWEYSPRIERSKIYTITELFKTKFGYSPKSFRAGRFGISHHTGQFLKEMGYLVDSSVTPGVMWTSKTGVQFPDFRNFGLKPYFIGEDGDIWKKGLSTLLEVPVTIFKYPKRKFLHFFNRGVKNIWLRPWYSNRKELISISDKVINDESGLDILVMMFHNVELVPGASPYPQTKSDVTKYISDLKYIFEYLQKSNVKPVTLKEYYQIYGRNI